MGTIVALAPNDWLGPWKNRQHLLSRLGGRGWSVVYSAGALDVWERATERWSRSGLRPSHRRCDNVTVEMPGRLFPTWSKWQRWNDFAISQHCNHLCKLVDRGSPLVLYVFHPDFSDYAARMPADKIIYHAYDAFSTTVPSPARWKERESFLVRKADLVIASSQMIAQGLTGLGAREVRVLPNGAAVELIHEAKGTLCPPDLAGIPTPRIGYTGAINPKVDLELILGLASRTPDLQWVFIGPVQNSLLQDNILARALEACRSASNIHFLGAKDIRELPAYLQGMDVNMMCYRTGGLEWWQSGYPLKMHEYLATGKPVVSSDLHAVREFREVIDIRNSADGWIEAVRSALESGGVGNPERRFAVARENSWDKRVDRLEGWLTELIST